MSISSQRPPGPEPWTFSGPLGSARSRALALTVYGLACTAYFVWRIGFTLKLGGPAQTAYSLLFLGAELALVPFWIVFYVHLASGVRRRDPPAPPEGATLDALICTYNEDVALVRATAVAARALGDHCKVWICDDGRRPEMVRLAGDLGVGYLTRPNNEHYKAGNLNHALTQTHGEFVLVLDADHVVRPQLLERTLGWFRDPLVAMTQIPQVYYNLESFQHAVWYDEPDLWHESSLFHHRMQPGADRWNCAFFVGTGAILRRSALQEIGGFATGTITEDIHTSLRLHERGYRSVYVDETLGVMLAAETPLAYALQRIRWAQGSMQVLRRERPLFKRGLTPWQRLAYTASLAGWLTSWVRALFYVAPGILLFSGLSPIDVNLSRGLPIFGAKIVLDLVVFALFAHPYARFFLSECFHMLTTPIGMLATATLVSPGERRFQVTPKGAQRGLPALLVIPVLGLALFNLGAVAVGAVHLASGALPMRSGALPLVFASWFGLTACWMLVYAWRRRASEELYSFPTRIPARLCAETHSEAEIVRLCTSFAYVHTDVHVQVGQAVELEDQAELGLWVDGVVAQVRPDPSERPGWLAKVQFKDAMVGRPLDAVDGYLFDSALPSFLQSKRCTAPGPAPEHPTAVLEEDAYALAPRIL